MKIAVMLLTVVLASAQDESNLIKFEAPKEWKKEEPKSNMRKAQYRVPDKEKTAKDAELTLFYFGNNAAMIQANMQRWARQMGAEQTKPEVIEGKCKVTLLDLKGRYAGGFGAPPIDDARMLAAVVEAEGGPWYFKLIGPADTVGDWRKEYVKLLKAAHK